MGGGRWNTSSYANKVSAAKKAGRSTFDYSDKVLSGKVSKKVNGILDPKALNTFGKNVRECLITDDHQNATPIAVFFDVTGSMGGIPRVLQAKLPQLHGLLQRKGYVEDPEILFGAVGDAYSDDFPLQVGQFESDNRMDDTIGNIILEGGGGGGNHESYELAAYYMARHATLDCNKNGRKGYMFIIGDERIYSRVRRHQVEALIGDSLEEDVSTEQIFRELEEKFNVFFLFAAQGCYEPGEVLTCENSGYYSGDVLYWRDLIGQNALKLDDADAVCETIALTIGLMEGVVDLDQGLDDLKDIGADIKAINATSKALAKIGEAAEANNVVTVINGILPADNGSNSIRL